MLTMNSKFQIGSHEQPIYRSYSRRYMGWRQLAWYYATALLFFVCLYRGFVSFFLLLVLLSRALKYWLLLSQNEKALNRFFLISALIFMVLSLRFIFPL